jgi:alpha-tubulin suppressor-like RCC1 family protein
VACGANHTVAVTDTGKVYEWGCPECALGAKPPREALLPQVVSLVEEVQVESIAAGM